MENNIDKDIEILKEHINFKTQFTLLNHEQEQIEAIENVLKDLEYNKRQFAVQLDEKLTLKSELETYKKIAERLAEEMMKLPEGNYYYDSKEGWLGWARKEVEK